MQKRGRLLISKVNSRGKWILMKEYMCTDTRYKLLIIGSIRVGKIVHFEAIALLEAQFMQVIIRWKCKLCHVKNPFRTVACWKSKTTLLAYLPLVALMELLFAGGVEHGRQKKVWQENTSTKACVLSV